METPERPKVPPYNPLYNPADLDEYDPASVDPGSAGPAGPRKKKSHTLPSLILTEPKESHERALLEWAKTLADLTPLQREMAKDAAKKVLKAEGYAAPATVINTALRTVQAKPTTQGQDLITPNPDPWPSPVDGARLLTAMRDTFLRYCILPRHAAEALALNALRTHVMDAFDVNPFIVLTSPVMRCGKTRVLHVSEDLVCRSMLVSGIKPAGFYRTIEESHPTLLLDEADTYDSIEEKYRGVLNSAHDRASAFYAVNVETRVEGSPTWASRKFSTYAPVYLGLIGTLPITVLDRSIVIHMKRKMKSEVIVLFGPDEQAALTSLKRQAIRWGLDHVKALRKASPAVPESLDDRAADNWRPLLAIADLVGGDWPTLARKAAETLSGDGQREEDESEGIALLRALRDILAPHEKMRSSDILEALNADDEGRWKGMNHGLGITGQDVSRILAPFEVKRKKGPLYFPPKAGHPASTKAKGYERSSFEETWARYLPMSTTSTDEGGVNIGVPAVMKEEGHTEKGVGGRGVEVGSVGRHRSLSALPRPDSLHRAVRGLPRVVRFPGWDGPVDQEALDQALRDLEAEEEDPSEEE